MIDSGVTGIYYKEGFKYQLTRTYSCQVGVSPLVDIYTEFISLYVNGTLVIRKGYAWDGSSGPAFDTKRTQRASLVHDALCQLIQTGKLDRKWKNRADREYMKICMENSVFPPMTTWRFIAIQFHNWEDTEVKEEIYAP